MSFHSLTNILATNTVIVEVEPLVEEWMLTYLIPYFITGVIYIFAWTLFVKTPFASQRFWKYLILLFTIPLANFAFTEILYSNAAMVILSYPSEGIGLDPTKLASDLYHMHKLEFIQHLLTGLPLCVSIFTLLCKRVSPQKVSLSE